MLLAEMRVKVQFIVKAAPKSRSRHRWFSRSSRISSVLTITVSSLRMNSISR